MAVAEIVRARIDADLKQEASAVLAGMGLTLSDAIRMLLVRIAAEKALPFDVRRPNSETQAAIFAAQRGEVARLDSISGLMADLNDDEH